MITIQWEYIPLIIIIICGTFVAIIGEDNFVTLIPGLLIFLSIITYIVMGIVWLITHINIV